MYMYMLRCIFSVLLHVQLTEKCSTLSSMLIFILTPYRSASSKGREMIPTNARKMNRGSVYTMYIHTCKKSDCLGCVVLLCLVACSTLLASYFLLSHLSLKHVYTQYEEYWLHMYLWARSCFVRGETLSSSASSCECLQGGDWEIQTSDWRTGWGSSGWSLTQTLGPCWVGGRGGRTDCTELLWSSSRPREGCRPVGCVRRACGVVCRSRGRIGGSGENLRQFLGCWLYLGRWEGRGEGERVKGEGEGGKGEGEGGRGEGERREEERREKMKDRWRRVEGRERERGGRKREERK